MYEYSRVMFLCTIQCKFRVEYEYKYMYAYILIIRVHYCRITCVRYIFIDGLFVGTVAVGVHGGAILSGPV